MGLTVEKCMQAWTNSLRQMNAKADIVFYGDSLIYYGDFALAFPDKVVCNLGLRGDTICGMINRIEQVQVLEPKQIFVMAGINDVNCVNVNKFGILYSRLIDVIVQVVPQCSVIVQNMLPVNALEYCVSCNNTQIDICNKMIRKIAEERSLFFLDINSLYKEDGQLPSFMSYDGIHLRYEAYFRWYELLRELSI